METHRGEFRLNRAEGKVLGVCAGMADRFDVDVTLVRVGVALAILTTFPVLLFGYFLLAMIAEAGPRHRGEVAPRLSQAQAEATRERMRNLDARMQAIESHVTSSNADLTREIDELR